MDKSRVYIVEDAPALPAREKASSIDKRKRASKILSVIVYVLLVPLTIFAGVVLLDNQKYNIISIAIALLVMLPIFLRFERGGKSARELVMIAIMCAIAIVSRLIFAPIPGFKPVTAIVIVSGIAFGWEGGFVVGAMTALVSNFFFGQGGWTPFQMVAWGVIGLIAGLLFSCAKKPNLILMLLLGAVSGFFFSLVMDIWTTISVDNVFMWQRYLVFITSALPFSVVYAVSNVIFLLLGGYQILGKLERIKDKYGVFARPQKKAKV